MSKNRNLPNYQSCPWCHENNDIGEDDCLMPVTCSHCGHRADVRQAQCDCRECLALRGFSADPVLTEQEYQQRRASFRLISNDRKSENELRSVLVSARRPKPVPVPSAQEIAERQARRKAEIKAEVDELFKELESERLYT